MGIRHLFIINPVAGKNDRTEELTKQIYSLGLEGGYAIEKSEFSGHTREIARKYSLLGNDHMRIYACGGDGTLSEVVGSVANMPNIAVAPVPIGSGNDFIRGFTDYLKQDFLDLERMTKGEEKEIDLIDINGIICMNIASVGYDSAVNKRMSYFRKLGGSAAYKLSCAWCVLDKMKHRFSMIADGKRIDAPNNEFLLCLAANSKYYGGGFKAAPLASLDDGLMDIVYIPKVSRAFFARFVSKFHNGDHLSLDAVHFTRCRELTFLSDTPLDLNIDGEVFTLKNPTLRIIPKAAKIILPSKSK